MPASRNSIKPQDSEDSYQDKILKIFKNKFGGWVHSYYFDLELENIRLVSEDKSKVRVVPAHEFPEA